MEKFEQKGSPQLRIETIKNPEGNEVSCCPERGGIVTSIKLQGKEVLYLDEETLKNKDVNVKGGVPIPFPNAGPIPDEIKTEELKNLKQHGFARELKWKLEKELDGFKETLISDQKTKEFYPYDFNLELDVHLENDNSITFVQKVENTGKENNIPISSGFHPYFKIPSEEKKNIEFNFKGGDLVKEQIEKWANGKAVSIENHNESIEIKIPNLGTLVFNILKEYKRIWIWSMGGKDFICVEPVMRDKGGIVLDPEKIKPGEKHQSSFNISLKQ